MTRSKRWRDVKRTSPTIDELERKFTAEIKQELTLAELRKAREQTQVELAETLDITQTSVSALEHRTDLYVSTLRNYVEALGGRLVIVAAFPDATVAIRDFAELADERREPDGEPVSA